MSFKYIIPFVVGLSIVLQGTLNRNTAGQMSLPTVVFLNALVFLLFSTASWVLESTLLGRNPSLSGNPFFNFQLWQLLPGLFGFFIVFFTPLAIDYFGANLAFSIIICTQLLVSVVWDSIERNKLPSTLSLFGALTMVIGLFILINGKK